MIITDELLGQPGWLDIFNRADDYVCEKYNLILDIDSEENNNREVAKCWEQEFNCQIEILEDDSFGDITFNTEHDWSLFLLKFS